MSQVQRMAHGAYRTKRLCPRGDGYVDRGRCMRMSPTAYVTKDKLKVRKDNSVANYMSHTVYVTYYMLQLLWIGGERQL